MYKLFGILLVDLGAIQESSGTIPFQFEIFGEPLMSWGGPHANDIRILLGKWFHLFGFSVDPRGSKDLQPQCAANDNISQKTKFVRTCWQSESNNFRSINEGL